MQRLKLRPSPRSSALEGRSRLEWAAIVSVAVHAALLVGAWLWFRHAPIASDAAQTPGAIELVMVEQQGHGETTAQPEPPPSPSAAPTPPPPPVPAPTPSQPAELRVPPPPPPAAAAEEAVPVPVPPPPPVVQPSPPTPAPPKVQPAPLPPPLRAQEAPQINIGGNDAETNAIALGPNVVPASVDNKFRNREPVYPLDAARRAEQGAVILLIHVSPQGLPTGVDIAQSSGFASLDRAARDAAISWHFLPAVQDGRPIAFDMLFRVVFHLE